MWLFEGIMIWNGIFLMWQESWKNLSFFHVVMEIQDEILADYADDFSKHAPVTENYVLNELISQKKNAFFWRSGNTAELNFIYENAGKVIPLEVKAATNTRAKSYRQFCKKYHSQRYLSIILYLMQRNAEVKRFILTWSIIMLRQKPFIRAFM